MTFNIKISYAILMVVVVVQISIYSERSLMYSPFQPVVGIQHCCAMLLNRQLARISKLGKSERPFTCEKNRDYLPGKWQELAIPYDEFDLFASDINEKTLVEIGRDNEVEHLSPGSFPYSPFPVTGRIHGHNLRFMAPLVVQRAGKKNGSIVNVWFLVDTGSPHTCLTFKTMERLIGLGTMAPAFCSMIIQDPTTEIECKPSKAHFLEVNLLGTDALRKLELSILVDWKKDRFQLIRP